jgi:hypothetical protein
VTEKFLVELSVIFKQLIIKKSKTSVLKEDMSGILNRYCGLYHEINDFFCDEAAKEKEFDSFQVFLGNQDHISNCFLLLSDHLKDNVKNSFFSHATFKYLMILYFN